MAATRASGFPVNITGSNTGTVNPQHVGDLMIVAGRRSSNVVDVTAISGGGCTNWTKVTERVDASDFLYGFLWFGTVSTTGSQTITLTVTDSPSSEITVDSFVAGTTGTWTVDASGAGGAGASVPSFPSLTPTKNGITSIPEVYYGWMFTNGAWSSGTTSGYTYEENPFFDGPIAWSVGVTTGAQAPNLTGAASALWNTVAAIFYLAPPVTAATLTPVAVAVKSVVANAVTAPAQATPVARTVAQALATLSSGLVVVGPLQFMIPLYIYPTSGTFWTDLASNPTNVAYVVANPGSGPGAAVNSDYTTGINNLRTAGIKVLGYVDTADGARGATFPTSAVSDTFTRTAENPLSNAGLWNTTSAPFAASSFLKTNGTAALSTAGNLVFAGSAIASTIALPFETYVDLTVAPTGSQYALLGWFSTLGGSPSGYALQFNASGSISVLRYTTGTGTVIATLSASVVNGDSIGMTITAGGLITAWRKHSGTWAAIGQIADTTYTAASFAILGTSGNTVTFDNFAAHSSGPAVEKQMDDWATFYSVDGYFLDNANNITGSESYYSALNAYAKAKNAAWITVNNYGTTMPSSYYPTADIHMNTEETESQLAANFQPLQGWESSHPASSFAEAIYSCTRANLSNDLTLVLGRNAYYVWLAEDTLYQTEPSYWTSTLQALVHPAPPAIAPIAVSRSAATTNVVGGLGVYAGIILADGPVGYWRLDEVSGTVANDLSGNGNNGTYSGGTGVTLNQVPGALDAAGDFNGAAAFDGAVGAVNVPDSTSLRGITTGVSLEAWVKSPNSVGGTIIAKGSGFRLVASPVSGILFEIAALTTARGNIIPNGEWQHIVLTWTQASGTVSLYQDNVLTGTATGFTGAISTTGALLNIAQFSNATWFSGQLDEVAVYNYALTSTQVSTHFTTGRPPKRLGPVARVLTSARAVITPPPYLIMAAVAQSISLTRASVTGPSGLIGAAPGVVIPVTNAGVAPAGYWRAVPGIVQSEWSYDISGNFYYKGPAGQPQATLCVDSAGNVKFYKGTLRPGQLVVASS